MTAAVLLGICAGFGLLGIVAGLRSSPPSLQVVAATMQRTFPSGAAPDARKRGNRLGRGMATLLSERDLLARPRLRRIGSALAITGEHPEDLASGCLLAGGAALLAPPVLWTVAACGGVPIPIAVPVVATVLLVPACAALPVASLIRRADERRRHFRSVISAFVDLVVLGLAGGVGIEGALFAAAQVTPDWAARRMARVLLGARDGGMPPWDALARLGDELGVHELGELAATLQLAGTEGTRVRQALRARSIALRRHEQAEAESAANATTERLFAPGALLLIGFLVFIGYPAFSRILGGF